MVEGLTTAAKAGAAVALAPFSLGASSWLSRPDTFTAAAVQRFKDSGINVFHIGVGLGAADPFQTTLRFAASTAITGSSTR
jgi:hypothetical protein